MIEGYTQQTARERQREKGEKDDPSTASARASKGQRKAHPLASETM